MKTKSEVVDELQSLCDAINAQEFGVMDDGVTASVTEKNTKGGAHISLSTPGVTFNGRSHEYASGLDTREQALEKAHKLQREKEVDRGVGWCDCIRGPMCMEYLVRYYQNAPVKEVIIKRFKFAETDDQ